MFRMRDNKFRKLWDGVQNLENLKVIDLKGSFYLNDIPDLSKATKLERVILAECHCLTQLIISNSTLKFLDLSECSQIESLNVHSKYLSQLNLVGCSSLTKISVASDELTELILDGMGNLESLNVNTRSLEELKLHGCSSLKEISVASEEITILDLSSTPITSLSISSLPKLTYLDLRNCGNLVSLPELPSALYGECL
ncbi:hypothetical protein Fmac_025551 [Flemingia macrophylla]|uniref:Uncharacterized protein n=1 Tax=Flemingia macrophylla TaxID=520843 RepID=A0ABD1LT57_9FABA